ncbi:MAG: hypothetical protein HWE22_11640 [Flavobacteriales bacterium]|nr:hypothetical protein [Flavobacteriales bacterium]
MSIKINYPVFLSSKPNGTDNIEGQSQTKVARIIAELIQDNQLDKKVIGLEGEWGAGKSNVIELLKKELDSQKYYTFIYDAWGYQEDLTRRLFLEQIIDELIDNNFLKDERKWNDKTNMLLARKSRSTKQTFPKFKFYWVLISLGAIFLAGLSSLYGSVIKDWDLVPTWSLGVWKPLVIIYAIPLIFFAWGAFLAFREYFKEKKVNDSRHRREKLSNREIISKIFFWLNGKNIETSELENVVDQEPSVRQFRSYFSEIERDISDRRIVVVFDNLDRLNNEKIKTLWSSIHTFFAEHSYEKIWVIVPYAKVKLAEAFENSDENGFIEKTFSISFRVSPPIVSAWDKLIEEKLTEAFGMDIIPVDEISYIKEIFDRNTDGGTIKPRQIINYVNQLVSFYKLWKEDVDSGSIKFRYLGLFIRTKDIILEDPSSRILQRDYLGNSSSLFAKDDDLDNIMSALVYNVSRVMADEILLRRELTQSIRRGEIEFIETSKHHSVFPKFFDEAYNEVDFPTKRKSLKKVLDAVSDVLREEVISQYWENSAIVLIDAEDEFTSFKSIHKEVLVNVSEKIQSKILDKLIKTISIKTENIEEQKKYYTQLSEIKAFCEEVGIVLKLEDFVDTVHFNPAAFMYAVEEEGQNWGKLNIECSEEELVEYFYEDGKVGFEFLFESLEFLKLVADNFEFDKIREDLISDLAELESFQGEDVSCIVAVLKIISKKPLSNVRLSDDFYDELTRENVDDGVFVDCIGIVIADFNNAINYTGSVSSLNEFNHADIEELASKIEWYIDYGTLLKNIVDSSFMDDYNVIIEVAKRLTNKSYGISRLNLSWHLENFSLVGKKVFQNDNRQILNYVKRLGGWSQYYNTKLFGKIDDEFFKYIEPHSGDLLTKIWVDSKTHFDSMGKNDLLKALKLKNKDYSIIQVVINKDKSIKFNDSFYNAYKEYLLESVLDEEIIELDAFLFKTLLVRLDGRKIKGIFARIKDKVLANPSAIGSGKISMLMDGMIRYGNLKKESDLVTYKLLDYIFESKSSINTIFEVHSSFFLDAILNSSEYIEDAKTSIVSSIDLIDNKEVRVEVVKKLKLKSRIKKLKEGKSN